MDAATLALLIGAIGAFAAAGAWAAAAYANRFQRSWVVEPQDENHVEYLVRNNTRRRADLLETKADPRWPDKATFFELDAPALSSVMPGEAFGAQMMHARAIRITWTRKPWWLLGGRKTYEQSYNLPLKYNPRAAPPPWWARLLRL